MPTEQARALALVLLGSYPGRQIGEMNVIAIANALDQFDVETASQVCNLLQRRTYDPPSVAQIFEAAREITKEMPWSSEEGERGSGGYAPLPSGPIKTRTVTEKNGETFEINAAWLDHLEQIRHPKRRPPMQSAPRCQGSGHEAVRKDGKLACPDCGVEVR